MKVSSGQSDLWIAQIAEAIAAVDKVSDYRVTNLCQVHSYLMSPASLDLDTQQRKRPEISILAVVRHRRAPPPGVYRYLLPVP